MGTGVGTERGAEGGRRGDLSREPEGASAPSRPDLSGLTSFFLCPSPSFPPLCLPVPSPMAKPCGLAPPSSSGIWLSLSLSPKLGCGVGMCRGVAAAAAGVAGAAGEERGEERGVRAGWGAQVQEQLRSCLQAGGSEASGGGGQRFLERRSHYTRLAL